MGEPLISVVMPTYNCKRHLEKSIDSILNQTYQNWEFIIADGHSTDGTAEILARYAEKDPRVRIVPDEKKGIGAALRQGCALAHGDYIARMDADDISLPCRLEKELKFLEEHREYALVTSVAIYIDEDDKEVGVSFPYTWPTILKRNLTSICHPCILMRKDMYEKAGGYPRIIRTEDNLMWRRLIRQGRFKILHEPLIKYRLSDDALTNTFSSESYLELSKQFEKYAKKDILTDEDYDQINAFIRSRLRKPEASKGYSKTNMEVRILTNLKRVLCHTTAYEITLWIKNFYGLYKELK